MTTPTVPTEDDTWRVKVVTVRTVTITAARSGDVPAIAIAALHSGEGRTTQEYLWAVRPDGSASLSRGNRNLWHFLDDDLGHAEWLSRLLFSAREELSMWLDVVERETGSPVPNIRSIISQIDAYRRARGWPADGFGGETSPQT